MGKPEGQEGCRKGKLTLGCHSSATSGRQVFTGLPLSIEIAAGQNDHFDQVVQSISQEDSNSKKHLYTQDSVSSERKGG